MDSIEGYRKTWKGDKSPEFYMLLGTEGFYICFQLLTFYDVSFLK